MKNTFLKLLTALFIIPFACNPKEEIAPENPCENAHAVSASFLIQEDWDQTDLGAEDWIYYDTDTVCTYRIKLTANEKDAISYRWKIGTDTTTFTQQSFTIRFPYTYVSTLSPKNISVTLVVNKTPNKLCLPNDDGIDTVTRIIHFVNDTGGNLIKGYFVGQWDNNPVNSDTIIINQYDSVQTFTGAYIHGKCIYGITPKYETTNISWKGCLSDGGQGYRELICRIDNAEWSAPAIIFLNKENKVTVSSKELHSAKIHHFTGKKL